MHTAHLSAACFLLLSCHAFGQFVTPPFFPEDNCVNRVASPDPLVDLGLSSPAINAYAGVFEQTSYGGGRTSGPVMNSTMPCRLTARVGETVSFNVIAEDVDPGDIVRIYVLMDPGLPNGAIVSADEYYQRCMPTTNASRGTDNSLGPCPACQNSGEYSYGYQMVPPTLPGVSPDYSKWLVNISKTYIPVEYRAWCMASTSGKPYGDGRAMKASDHGRLVMRKFIWTPLAVQGMCDAPVSCKYIVKFQAFDKYGTPSAIKTFEIAVLKAVPEYAVGTIGLVLGAPTAPYIDSVTGAESHASTTPFETSTNWMLDKKNYAAYVNCPMELTVGVFGLGYNVELSHTSLNPPPGAVVEWRARSHHCVDTLNGTNPWHDAKGNSCADYVRLRWCSEGGVGPDWPGGSFRSMAMGGLVAADQACCACGAGTQNPCSSYTSQQTCTPIGATAANPSNNTVYPRQQGCRWERNTCMGQSRVYHVTSGQYSPVWHPSSSSIPGQEVVAVFKWTPLRGMEGQEHQICFRGGEVHGMNTLSEVCGFIQVKRCYYCARVGETLKYVAEMYNLDTNWLRLWNYNPTITDPDLILRSYLPLAIGSTYEVQPGDTLARIAARLRTTVKKILEVNPDMVDTNLVVGQDVCIMPCTQNPFKDDPINPYNPASINGVPVPFSEFLPRVSRDPSFN